jgi:ATP-dependent DNA ligase
MTDALVTAPAKAPPSGPDWLHEIKHDGFRILALRDDLPECGAFVADQIKR